MLFFAYLHIFPLVPLWMLDHILHGAPNDA